MIRDLRKYARQTNFRLLVGGISLLFIIGIGLIWLFFGGAAAMGGLTCLILGLAPLLLVWLILTGLEWIVKRANPED